MKINANLLRIAAVVLSLTLLQACTSSAIVNQGREDIKRLVDNACPPDLTVEEMFTICPQRYNVAMGMALDLDETSASLENTSALIRGSKQAGAILTPVKEIVNVAVGVETVSHIRQQTRLAKKKTTLTEAQTTLTESESVRQLAEAENAGMPDTVITNTIGDVNASVGDVSSSSETGGIGVNVNPNIDASGATVNNSNNNTNNNNNSELSNGISHIGIDQGVNLITGQDGTQYIPCDKKNPYLLCPVHK